MNKIYDVLRVINGKILFLKDHQYRWQKSYQLNNMPGEIDIVKITTDIKKLIKKDQIKNQNIRIEIGKMVSIKVVESNYPTKEMYDRGVVVETVHLERDHPNIKSVNLDYKKQVNELIRKKNVFEVLLVDDHENITEGSRSNIFFIKNNIIYTSESKKVLEGITRKNVLDVIQKLKFPLVKKSIKLTDLDSIQSAFLTGTSIGVLPISKINNYFFDSFSDNKVVKIKKEFDKKTSE